MVRIGLFFASVALTTAVLGMYFGIGFHSRAASAQDVTPLNSAGFALVSDSVRRQLYVSLPGANEVDVLSMSTLQITNRVLLGGQRPEGMSLSLDGSKLYVALNQGGSVGVIDLSSLTTSFIDVSVQLGDSRVWDVVEGRPNRLYVSANPGSSGFSWLASIATDQSNQVTRIQSGGIIRGAPVFLPSPDHQFLYVGESAFSPESLHKFDIRTDTPSLVLDAPFGSVSGTRAMDVSPDGLRLYTLSGQVLRTDSLTQVGGIVFGVPRVNADGSFLYVGNGTTVHAFNRASLVEVGGFTSPCSIDRLTLGANSNELFALGTDGVCRVSLVPAPPTATATITSTSTPTRTATSTPTSTPTPGPVNGGGGRASTIHGLFGTLSFPNAARSGGHVRFDRPVRSTKYTVLLTAENRGCTPVITTKAPDGFSFSCAGVGGAVDWAVLDPTGNDQSEGGIGATP